ncbi:MAG: fimbria/pilus outer membrane usher protein [Nitrospiria bacterium]
MWIKTYVLNSLIWLIFYASTVFAVNIQTVILNVTLNGQAKGDLFVNLTDDRDILLPRHDLHAIGIRHISGEGIEIEREIFFSLRAMEGIVFQFDDEQLLLKISAAPHLLEEQIIDFDNTRHKILDYTSETSAYLNYKLDYSTTNLPRSDDIELIHQLGAHHQGWSFSSDAIVSKFGDKEKWTRFMTHLTHDRPESKNRLIVGDFFARSSEIGSSLTMGGLSFSRHYPLNPFFIRSPQVVFAGATALETEMEVLLDGVPIHRSTLAPGEFRLENISARSGAGLLEVILKDPFGKEERLIMPFYISEALLKKGLHDFSYNVGFLRKDFGEKNAAYGPLAFSGYHKYGVSDVFNIEASLEWVRRKAVFTTSTYTLLDDLGTLTTLLAASRNDGGRFGEAARLRYAYLGRQINGRFDLTWRDPDFIPVQTSIGTPPPKVEAGAGLGFGTRDLGFLNFDYRRAKNTEDPDTWTAAVSYTRPINGQTSVLASLSQSEGQRTETTFFIGIQYYPGNQTTLSAQQQIQKDSDLASLQVHKNPPVGEGVGGRARFEKSTLEDASIKTYDVFLQRNLQTLILGGQFRHVEGITFEDYSIAGAVSFVGNRLSLSRPITDSFGLVHAEGLKGVRIYHNGQEIGQTDRSGRLLIPNLSPYYDNKVVIDDRDIPLDYSISKVKDTVSPFFGSGTIIPFEVKKFQAVGGRVHYRLEGKTLPAELLLVNLKKGEDLFQFQTGFDGEFYLENLDAGRYGTSFEIGDRTCVFDLVIPATTELFTDLGDLVCETHP